MKKIVVVDDQPLVGSIYRTKFTAEGFQVDVALDGQEALKLIERTSPDILLLDLMLPKTNGLEVLKTLRANPSFVSLPIIVLTASGRPGIVEEAQTAGATLVLSKINTSPKQILELVQKTLQTASEARATKESGTSLVNDSATRGNILLVEQRADTRLIITHLLESAGHKVSTARDMNEIIASGNAESFDLFLISHGRADSSTLFCQSMRTQLIDKPIVIYSMAASSSQKDEVLRAGATSYIATPDELLNIAAIASRVIHDNQDSAGSTSRTGLAPAVVN